mgnify:CR=1
MALGCDQIWASLDKIGWQTGGDPRWETGQSNDGIKRSCRVAPKDDFQMACGLIECALAGDGLCFCGGDL